MKRKRRPKLKGRPKNLPTDRFVQVSGVHLGAALKASGLTLQGASASLAELGTPISYPVLSRLISGINKRTRASILGNISKLTPGISREWLSGELDEELDEALENELRGEQEPETKIAVPITLTYVVERQRLADWIQSASDRDGSEASDWFAIVGMALSLQHARSQWRGALVTTARPTVREFNVFAKSEASAWRAKLWPWLTGDERLRAMDVAKRHAEITRSLTRSEADGMSLARGLPPLPRD